MKFKLDALKAQITKQLDGIDALAEDELAAANEARQRDYEYRLRQYEDLVERFKNETLPYGTAKPEEPKPYTLETYQGGQANHQRKRLRRLENLMNMVAADKDGNVSFSATELQTFGIGYILDI